MRGDCIEIDRPIHKEEEGGCHKGDNNAPIEEGIFEEQSILFSEAEQNHNESERPADSLRHQLQGIYA